MDPLHSLTLADLVREHRRSRPDQLAAVDGSTRLTYPALDDRVNRLARALAGAGVGSGDRILWLGQNSFRVLELLLAAAKLGAMLCPANWRQSVDETVFVLDDLAPSVVVWQDEEIGETVHAARDKVGDGARWLRHDGEGPGTYEAFLRAATDDDLGVDVDPSDPLLVMYTAAFTGRPNGAMLSHTALIGQGIVMGRAADIGADYVYLNSGPLFHIATFMTTLATLVAGGTNVFVRRVDAEELCRVIEAERCTGAFLVGPTFKQVLELNADRGYDLKSLRASAGRPEWNEMVTIDTSPWARNPGGYGQTEAVGMATFNTVAGTTLGTHGRPGPLTQLRILDPDGNEVADGETGEIALRGPTVMNGYWNRPDENARRRRDGWHLTSDLGRREPDGTITFIGPTTRMIKSAAENIYPAEVEGCLRAHPAVADAAVIGVPDRRWTQNVTAIIVPRPGQETTPELASDIIDHCRARIASYKKPRAVEFVDALPRVGFAVDYDALDERFGGGGYPGGRNRSA